MTDERPTDLIRVAEARRLLGVSPAKMAQLIRARVLRHFPDPLDARVKLVSKSAVRELLRRRGKAA